jgi:uncharacterized LabA/DUF88 family protein
VGRPRRLIVYVDGFNLYHGMHDEARCRLLWLDLVRLAQLLSPKDDLQVVRYFTAPVLDNPGAESRQMTYINALDALHGDLIDTVMGRYQAKTMTCRRCGGQYTAYEEKETDVNIAVNLTVDAGRRAMDSALVVSADSDVAPAIRAAWKLHPNLFVAAAFPPNRSSSELRALMPNSYQIGVARLRKAQMPDVVEKDGLTFERPEKWAWIRGG